MRILMAGLGGSVALRRVVDWACEAGHHVCLVVNSDPYVRQKSDNLTLVQCDLDCALTAQEVAREPEHQIQRMVELLRVISAEFQPDLIHLHHLNLITYSCVVAELHYPIILSAWGMLNGLLNTDVVQPQNSAVQKMVVSADALIVESPALVTCCEQLHPRPAHIELIPLGTNTRLFRPASPLQRHAHRRFLSVAPDTILLLSPRGWSRVYRHEQIFAAYRLARPHFAKRTALAFIKLGRSKTAQDAEALFAQMRQMVAHAQLTDEVIWLPGLIHEMMPAVYNAADVVVNYPSRDAFPSTLVEAVACERPVITAALPSYANTFIDHHCTLVEPNLSSKTPDALAEAMVELVNGTVVQTETELQAARQRIIEQYDETIFKQRLLDLYERLGG